MSQREVNFLECTRLKLPFGGRWFYRQQPALQAHEEKKGILLAWDTPTGTKIFGIYQDYPKAELMRRLLVIPLEQRHCYELIPKTDMCAGYMLLKWEGTPDPEHATLCEILVWLQARCSEVLNITPDPCAYCGSHPMADAVSVRHMYYIIVRNLVFKNNHNGQMKAFFDLGTDKINLAAYTRNRQLLLPNCCPSGTAIPLTSVNKQATLFGASHAQAFVTDPASPTANQFVFDQMRPQDDHRWDPCALSDAVAAEVIHPPLRQAIPVAVPVPPLELPREVPAPPPKKARLSPHPLPFSVGVLEDMVRRASSGSVDGKLFLDPACETGKQQWTLYTKPEHPTNAWQCLKCRERIHATTQFSLLIQPCPEGFSVAYQCTQDACWNTPDASLGMVVLDPQPRPVLAHQFPLRSVDETMELPFPHLFLSELLSRTAGVAAKPVSARYINEDTSWRVCMRPDRTQNGAIAKWIHRSDDAALHVTHNAGAFEVSYQCLLQPSRRLAIGTITLSPRGVWTVVEAQR